MSDAPAIQLRRFTGPLLVGAIFVLAICALVYELIAGALSSYLLGDSITQFSLVIGLFLTSMGVGSYLSQFIRHELLAALIEIELWIGIVGGLTALLGFAAFAHTTFYTPVLLSLVAIVGTLVGLEIPLVVRILRELGTLRVTLANVLSADYLGALAASLLFPFLLLPQLGIVRAGLLTGLLNVGVAGLMYLAFRPAIGKRHRRVQVIAIGAAIILLTSFAGAGRLVAWFENRIYADEIVLAQDSSYQRVVLTRWREDVRLYLDGHLQFSSIDEYRYHEPLVLPAMCLAERRERVLILGGGDGLAARQVLKFDDVQRIDLVDLDPVVTNLFSTRPMLTKLNQNALKDSRMTVHNQDALQFLQAAATRYDVIIMDLPDPGRPEIAKLYTREFFGVAAQRLAAGGVLVTQATSPFRSRKAFWCIANTLAATPSGEFEEGFRVQPYQTYVPSFGTWGFVLAARRELQLDAASIEVPAKFLSTPVLKSMFVFPPDTAHVDTPINTLNDPVVWRLYQHGYHEYLE
ncbi:MAG: polyamine aminopropyltransferase [Planctomycetes bacterium]|nr:polyamine aminopropyltransferase [Planctomycetota bacterium]